MAAFTLHEDEMEVYLAKVHICRKHGNKKGGDGPPTSPLAIAGRKNGKDPFHVLGWFSLLQRISETKKIDDEIFLCWRQRQNSYSLLQGQDLPLFKKLIMSCKIQLKIGASWSCATLTFSLLSQIKNHI